MIVTFCFSLKDQELALENIKWCNELGGCHGHTALVGYDLRCAMTDLDQVEAIRQEFVKAFDKVYLLKVAAQIDGWPEGANYFFRLVCAELQNRPDCRSFFWLEPDAIPLKAGWLDAIAAEYERAGRPFMGDRVEVGDIPLHMSGVGVYPNPLHQFAGEAYRAAETAWDMAAKDQIVPQAHFTKLIEHAWKHPQFTNLHELETQIRPEAVIFHSSKDGSLIRLLRTKNLSGAVKSEQHSPVNDSKDRSQGAPAAQEISPGNDSTHKAKAPKDREEPRSPGETTFPVPVLAEPSGHRSESASEDLRTRSEARESTPSPVPDSKLHPRGGENIYYIFIRSYAPDFDWLSYAVQAIDKFATGFRKVWIVSPHNPPVWMLERKGGIEIQWKVVNDESQDGYLSQQIHKLYADVLTDYQADYILHIDSDVILTSPITPQSFFKEGKIIWPFTPYTAIETPWKEITEKFLGRTVENEFMRRFPIMLPKWLYSKLREYGFKEHRQPVADYVKAQPLRAFSEFNALGAYAYQFHRDKFEWVNTLQQEGNPAPFARQFHSWGGLTEEIKNEIEALLRGGAEAARLAHNQEAEGSIPSPAIKKLPNGIWVFAGEDQISHWVEECGRLDHDPNLLPFILSQIKEGDIVVDAGAFIGDHTIAYSRKVGDRGTVFAIEPNPVAQECLFHNLDAQSNVVPLRFGLSDRTETVPLSGNNGQPSGGYIGVDQQVAEVALYPLDSVQMIGAANLIKLDVEGYELKALKGAERTIEKHRPKIILEINQLALQRQGTDESAIFEWLYDHNYGWRIIEENARRGDPLYNIVCLANRELPVKTASDLMPKEKMIEQVAALKAYAASSPGNRVSVMVHLSHAGLRPYVPKKRKKPK